ncbi:MAG: O-acetyl-ADP-ribose deacetylase [Candidatus Latescibacterota bacterium]
MAEYMNGRVMVKTGDITREEVDAIVNAANSTLYGGGGVDGAIHRIGGPEILEACQRIRANQFPNGLPTGEAVITTGGRLPAKYVIHTVGPVWMGGTHGEEKLLGNCYWNSLKPAENGCRTVAFPAISTGAYRFPRDKAALIASSTVKDFLERNPLPEQVLFVFFSGDNEQTFLENCRF